MTIWTQIPSKTHLSKEPLTPGDEQEGGFKFIGCRLAMARETLGLSIQDATDVTGITTQNLRLLEAGNLQAALAATYVKGYIKCYAKVLKLPLEDLMQAYQEGIDQVRHQNSLKADRQPKKNRLGFKIAAAVAALVLIVFMFFLVMPAQSGMLLEAAGKVSQSTFSDNLDSDKLTANSLLVESFVDSWVEITDSEGSILKAALIPAKQRLIVDGQPPFKLVVSQGGKVVVNYLEQSIHLAADSGDNKARIILGD